VHHCALRITESNRVPQSGDREVGRHAFADRIALDARGVGVLEQAEVDLAFIRRVFGDVREPQLVHVSGREVASHEIVVNGRPGLLARPTLLHETGPNRHVRAQAPHVAFTHALKNYDLVGSIGRRARPMTMPPRSVDFSI